MAPDPEKRRVLIVDDHPIVREGLVALIVRQPDLCIADQVGDPNAALRSVNDRSPDLAIVDLALGRQCGLDLITRLVERRPGLPVLALSMFDEMVYADRALRAGARGYVTKQEASTLLLTAIRQVLAGAVFVSPAVTAQLVRGLVGDRGTTVDGVATLTDRELEVFRLIGSGVGTAEIAESMYLSRKTVETHRSRIKQKLGIETATELIVRAARWLDGEALAAAATSGRR